MLNLSAPDLTQHPPRSPYARLGGYAHLPRLLDKARATVAGKVGDYHYNCPMDQHFFAFTGITEAEMLAEVKAGKSDSQILAFVQEKSKRLPAEIAAWSHWLAGNAPGGSPGHAWMSEVIKTGAPDRTDISTFFDLLDLDDYVTFGGKG
jgi:hypothetical protein